MRYFTFFFILRLKNPPCVLYHISVALATFQCSQAHVTPADSAVLEDQTDKKRRNKLNYKVLQIQGSSEGFS